MKIETAIKKVVEFLQNNPGSTKEQIGTATKVNGIELTNVIRSLRKIGGLEEQGEGKDATFSIMESTGTASSETEVPVEDEQLPAKPKGRNNDKYQFNGNEYGKGPLVREVVRQYVADHPKTSLSNYAKSSLMSYYTASVFSRILIKRVNYQAPVTVTSSRMNTRLNLATVKLSWCATSSLRITYSPS